MLLALTIALLGVGLVGAPTPAQPAAAAAAGLVNAGLEGTYPPVRSSYVGLSGTVARGWTAAAFGTGAVAVFAPTTDAVHQGSSAQRLDVSASGTGAVQLLQSLPTASVDRLVGISLWLRGTPGVAVSGAVQLARAPHEAFAQTALTLSAQWQLLRLVGRVPAGTPVNLVVSVREEGLVDVDDGSLETAPFEVTGRPDAEPLRRVDFGQHVNETLASTLRNGGMEGPSVRAITSSPQVVTGSLAPGWLDNSQTADVTVAYGKDAAVRRSGSASQRVSLTAVRSGVQEIRQRLVLLSPATYRIDVWVKGQVGQRLQAELHRGTAPYKVVGSGAVAATGAWQRLRFTAALPLGVDSTYLTIGTKDPGVYRVDDVSVTAADGTPLVERTPGTAYGTVRTWNAAWWATVEPARGRFDWTVLDRVVGAAAAEGREVVLTLGQTPDWASTCPERDTLYGMGAPCAPADLAYWTDFVTAVATRYGDLVGSYEVWNEPHDPDYGQLGVDDLVTLTRATRQVLDVVAPTARVIAPAAYSAGWLDAFLAAGGGQWADVVAVHTYVTPPEDAAVALAVVRRVLAARGATQPVWLTEGATGDAQTAPDEQAVLVARQLLVSFGWGADRFVYYTWGTGFDGSGPMVTPGSLAPNAAASAFDQVANLLVGSTITGATTSPEGVWTVTLEATAGGTGQVVWAPDGEQTIPVPAFGPTTITALDGATTPVSGTTIVVGPRPQLLT